MLQKQRLGKKHAWRRDARTAQLSTGRTGLLSLDFDEIIRFVRF
jgi:hypothetical protein